MILHHVAMALCVLIAALLTDAHLTISVKDAPLISVHTFDFLLDPFRPFQCTGVYAPVRLDWNSTTQNCVASVESPLARNDTVLVVQWENARESCQLQTFSQLWSIVQDLGWSSSFTLVVASNIHHTREIGAPVREAFIGRTPTTTEAPPPAGWHVAFVRDSEWVLVQPKLEQFRAQSITMHVVAEQNPWSIAYGSLVYRIPMFVMFAYVVIALIHGTYLFFRHVQANGIKWNVRNFTFLFTIIGMAIVLPVLLTQPYSYRHKFLIRLCLIFLSLAVHSLIYLWTVLQMLIKPSRIVYLMRVLIFISLFGSFLSFSLGIVHWNTLVDANPKALEYINQRFQATKQLIMALLFSMFAIQFMYQRSNVMSAHTSMALNRLFVLATVCFGVYLGLFIMNRLSNLKYLHTAWSCMLGDVASATLHIVRASALLTVLGVTMPAKSKS